jgi:hypothetical protein
MKKPLVPLTALVIGIAAALAAYNIMNGLGFRSLPLGRMVVIGEIQSVKGDVERRLPENVQIEAVRGPAPLHSQETIFTQKDSQAVVSFSDGTTLRLAENSRFVAEVDASKKEAVIGTLLDGSVNVLNTGKPGFFRLFQNGHEASLSTTEEKSLVSLIPANSVPANGSEPLRHAGPGAEPGLVISATQAEEPAANTLTSATPSTAASDSESAGANATSDNLTNDDIVRQLRGQMGFFQRCYLTFLHRAQATGSGTAAGSSTGGNGIGPTGSIVAGFKILPSGKVSDVKIAHSDFTDGILNRCVTEVIERTQFRAFNGTAIPVQEFPIKLQ